MQVIEDSDIRCGVRCHECGKRLQGALLDGPREYDQEGEVVAIEASCTCGAPIKVLND